jgi:putative membrane protein
VLAALRTAVSVPAWTAHPDVWLLVGLIAAVYAIAILRVGPIVVGSHQPVVTRSQVTCFALGLAAMWVAADWPIHDVAERFNYSVHMVQHLTLSMLSAPLLLLGTPAWLMRRVLPPGIVFRTVRRLTRFVPALVLFNVVLVVMHWPAVVNAGLQSHLTHFLLHGLLFVSSLVVWLPIVSPLPEIPRLTPVARLLYLFAWSVVPTVPASFLTFGSTPLYKFYEHVPHLWGLSTVQDQQLAGLIMKLGAGLLLWSLIAVLFFRWAQEEERASTPRTAVREMEAELARMGLRR